MQKTKRLLSLISLIGVTALAGCVYKIDIQQGNIVTQDMVDKLRPGMPVEIYLTTEDRTALSYLLKPFSDQIAKAFRER